MSKIEALEHRVAALRGQYSNVTVIYRDGTQKTMPLVAVIPLLKHPAVDEIIDIDGMAQPGDGRLLEIAKALLQDV